MSELAKPGRREFHFGVDTHREQDGFRIVLRYNGEAYPWVWRNGKDAGA